MSFTGPIILDAAHSPVTAADKTDRAPETGAKQEDVDTATTSNYRLIQARSSVKKNPESPMANQTLC